MDPLLSSVIGPDYLTEHQSLSGHIYCLNNGNTYICVVLNQNCLIFGHLDTFDVDLFLFFVKFHSWVKKKLGKCFDNLYHDLQYINMLQILFRNLYRDSLR